MNNKGSDMAAIPKMVSKLLKWSKNYSFIVTKKLVVRKDSYLAKGFIAVGKKTEKFFVTFDHCKRVV